MNPKLKILGKLGAAGAVVAGGSGIASLASGEKIAYKTISKSIDQNDAKNKGAEKYTSTVMYEMTGLVQEYSAVKEGDGWRGYLYDHIHERENSACVFYIKKNNGDRIRVSSQKPEGVREGIYAGWKLNEFSWTGAKKTSKPWYGYCSPNGSDAEGGGCDDLPEGWTRREL